MDISHLRAWQKQGCWAIWGCHPSVWHDAFIRVTLLTFVRDKGGEAELYACAIQVCDMTHSYVWHDAFICVTWLCYMCDRGGEAELYECAIQVKRYSVLLPDTSVREFCEKVRIYISTCVYMAELYECAIKIKRYSVLLLDTSVGEFCAKVRIYICTCVYISSYLSQALLSVCTRRQCS